MAPQFRHGKGTRVLINQFDFSASMQDVKFTSVAPSADVTCFQQNDMNYIPGIREGKISLDGRFAFSTGAASTSPDRVFANYLGGSTQWVLSIGPEGQSTGGWAFMLKSDETAHDIDSPIEGVVSLAAQAQGSSFHTGGVFLRPLTTAHSTAVGGTNTGVVFAGSTATGFSTGGGVGQLHVTYTTKVTGTRTATFKIQHSTSGSTWADLIVFTNATKATFQRSTVAGNVKERLRSTISAFAGSSGGLTAAVTFARNGKARG